MTRYVVRRVLAMIPVLIGTTLAIYAAVYALPGNPVQALFGPQQVVSPAVAHAIRDHFHLNEPFVVQYWDYLTGLVRGNFGVDFNNTPVASIIASSWPVTATLAVTAWVLESVIGVALGVVAALRSGRFADFAVLGGSTLVLGVPYFVIAFVAQIVVGVKLHWFPVSGVSDGWPLSYLVPALCLALLGLPQIARVTRASILENLHADYVDTATVKGMSRKRVLTVHVLRNSLIPVVSLLALSLGTLLGGTVLIESIFNLPGLGDQVYLGIQQHDGPVVVGIGTLLVLVFLVINFAVDLLYGVLDPRIRLSS